LITGATGTGKTVTLQTMTEQFSRIGVPVFVADVKGDLSGMAAAGGDNARIVQRARELSVELLHEPCPVVFWDVFGDDGHPLRATVSDLGPLLLARMLELNDVQEGVLNLVFKVADDAGLLLLDSKDLRATLQHAADNAAKLTVEYGNVSAASIGAIQRGLLALEGQGADHFFGEPMLNVADLIRTERGKGVVNILAAQRLLTSPKLYGIVLLWLLAELFEQLPEIGDPEQPRLVFFFDEAHLLFEDAPKALLDKIEQVVRLVRSKGVGVYFVTQNPLDIPDSVLAQLGNRVQHALRAFTPRDQKAVRAAAQTMRANANLSIEQAIGELAVGEALVSLLDGQGRPGVTERALIVPPGSRVGPLTRGERAQVRTTSPLAAAYDRTIDRESAFEKLRARVDGAGGATVQESRTGPSKDLLSEILFGRRGPRGGRQSEGLIEAMAKSVARSAGSQAGRTLVRGILGSLRGARR
jgi:DNA helicase HerA-like ATPase